MDAYHYLSCFAKSFGSVGIACSMFSIESLVLPLGTFSPRVDGCNTPGGQNVYSLSWWSCWLIMIRMRKGRKTTIKTRTVVTQAGGHNVYRLMLFGNNDNDEDEWAQGLGKCKTTKTRRIFKDRIFFWKFCIFVSKNWCRAKECSQTDWLQSCFAKSNCVWFVSVVLLRLAHNISSLESAHNTSSWWSVINLYVCFFLMFNIFKI